MRTGAMLSLPIAVLCAATSAAVPADGLEEIYVLRSIRESDGPAPGRCTRERVGFAPLTQDGERHFSFWSVAVEPHTGRMTDAAVERVGELIGCFGGTDEPARQNFYAEIRLGQTSFAGRGECLALQIDSPEPGLFPVRCQLVLSGLPAPYVGGTLTTNTMTTRARFGGASDPPGYTQASIATVRLWKARAGD